MNCDRFAPGRDDRRSCLRSNLAASRIRLLFSPPHKPLSVLTRMTARFLTARFSISGSLKSAGHGAGDLAQHLVHQRGIRTSRQRGLWALRILDAATICMALVICAVFLTDLMRRRMSRVLGMNAQR